MEPERNINLTSAELSGLWTTYINDSMAIPVIEYYLKHTTDEKIKDVLTFAKSLSKQHLEEITVIFNEEKFPIPYGFTNDDVNVEAPQLFSENFHLAYIYYMGKSGMEAYSMALSFSARNDLCELFNKYWNQSAELMKKSMDILLEKGIFTRPPFMPVPEQVEFVQNKSYLNGWFGGKRPLNAIEATHVFGNMKTNEMGKTLITGFAQVAKSQQVRDFFIRGKKIATKHTGVFSSLLQKSDLPATMTADATVFPSNTPPFSDKLMMFHISAMTSIGIGKYGIAMSVCTRHDLAFQYGKLLAEIGTYAEDGADIMIENKWMEQPPQVPNYEARANR
ncbi:DUF3231 family protein [Aquibacillus albus]|uniref:DUF3231 family protein n=1 Tax=Aquibacillus albus TaxID=1168171 RepID=A0ABS2N0B0_9BACI|nr:DUF3231 family protein [Aquibacillus albus]MBM7571335.1 hypothetical protein [Aquibacillus albus]